ncbi:hypothetical protein F5878DRAFT_639829 [Lentinula raphanica]|uniref:Uncharacterized protein n=1 Tax=Lentinula raphanica TaxID=153919 RepID=A0AA38PDY1_9AGAR|nr:hypothetical protein F5878DRAFT_639829 [Lentinula raphanica]
MRPTATHFLFTITTLQFVASMESNLGGCASSQEVSSPGGESRPLSNAEKLTLTKFPLSEYCKPSENWPGKTPENPLTYKHLASSQRIPPSPGPAPRTPLPHPPQSGPPPTGPLPPLPGSKNPVPLDNTAPPPIPRRSSRRPTEIPALRLPQVQEKRGYYEPVGTDYASNTAPDAAAAIDEDPSDTDSAIVQSTEGRSPTGKEIRLTRAFNRRRILDWDLD